MGIDLEKYRKKPASTGSEVDFSKYRKATSTPAPAEPAAPAEGQSLWSKMGGVINAAGQTQINAAGGFLEGFNSIGRGVQSALPSFLTTVPDFKTGAPGQTADEQGRDKRLGFLGADPNAMSTKVGEVAGEIAPYFTPSGASKAAPFLVKTGLNAVKNTAIGSSQTGDVKEGLAIGIGGELLGIAGKILKPVGKGLFNALAVPLSKREAGLLQSYRANNTFGERIIQALSGNSKAPVTASETAFNKGLFGTESMIGVQATKAKNAVWKGIVEPALKQADNRVEVSMPDFFDDVAAQIKKENPELTRQKSLLNALEAIKEDYVDVANVSVSKLQNFKEGWAKFVPQKAYRGEDIAGALNDVRNTIANHARKTIYAAIDDPAVRQAYTDYGNLIGLQQWGQKAMTGGKFKGGTGSFLSAAKDAILTPISTIGGHVLYTTGEGIQFIAAPGVKTIFDIINEGSQPSPPQREE